MTATRPLHDGYATAPWQVREKAALAKQKLLDGAGSLVDPAKRPRAISSLIAAELRALQPAAPAAVACYIGDTAAELLEQRLGGAVKAELLAEVRAP